jgi:hypothetical protein
MSRSCSCRSVPAIHAELVPRSHLSLLLARPQQLHAGRSASFPRPAALRVTSRQAGCPAPACARTDHDRRQAIRTQTRKDGPAPASRQPFHQDRATCSGPAKAEPIQAVHRTKVRPHPPFSSNQLRANDLFSDAGFGSRSCTGSTVCDQTVSPQDYVNRPITLATAGWLSQPNFAVDSGWTQENPPHHAVVVQQ